MLNQQLCLMNICSIVTSIDNNFMGEDEKAIKVLVEENSNIPVTDIERVSGGLVHYVYKVKTNDTYLFIKIRKAHYSALQHISTKPEWIQYEYKALKIASRIEPDIFPQVLEYIPKKHMLILSDIMPHRRTLESGLNTSSISPKEVNDLGKTLAKIHKKLSMIKTPIREDGDVEYYDQLLYYRFGYLSHPILDELVLSLKVLPRQLTVGDLSPKNIGISPKGKITICDLENFHYGTAISDVGFLGSSLILHTINNPELAYKLLISFLHGYSSEAKNDMQDIMLKRIVLGVGLYRLANPVIPYELPITTKERKEKVETIKRSLSMQELSWLQLVNDMTFARNT